MKKLIINGKILSPKRLPDHHAILIEDDLIVAVDQEDQFPQDLPTLDAKSQWVTPGLIDIHVHGGGGSDTMDAQQHALQTMGRFFASTGVTSFLPTTGAASNQDILNSIEAVGSFQSQPNSARVLGIHLEGPFLGHKHKGAQPEQHLRHADPREYLPWLQSELVKLFTVAPEVDGVVDLIRAGRKFGVRFAVGHSSATHEEMAQAIDAGLTQVTHTFNGMAPLHHREPGILGVVLTDDRVYTQVITDGVHIHPLVVKLLFKVKGVGRTVVITDAIRAVGAADGVHRLGDQVIHVKKGIARTESGSLAGSTLTMDQGLRNACEYTHSSFATLLPSATSVAAESIGMEHEIGSIKPGYKADLAFFDQDYVPQLTMVDGKVVYRR